MIRTMLSGIPDTSVRFVDESTRAAACPPFKVPRR
jgi:hypothetical protein